MAELADGDELSAVTFTGKETAAGYYSGANTFENVVIVSKTRTEDGKPKDVTANYAITADPGDMLIAGVTLTPGKVPGGDSRDEIRNDLIVYTEKTDTASEYDITLRISTYPNLTAENEPIIYMYSLDGSDYSETLSIPKNAGEYKVWFKAVTESGSVDIGGTFNVQHTIVWRDYELYDEVDDIPDVLTKLYSDTAGIKQEFYDTKVKKLSYDEKNTILYDVFVKYQSIDSGAWERVYTDPYGVTVTVPYPEGVSSSSYKIAGWHMFETGEPGSIENLDEHSVGGNSMITEKTGITITLSTFSPVMIAWKQNASGVVWGNGSGGVQTGDEVQLMLWAANGLASAAAATGIAAKLKGTKKKKDEEDR